MVKEMICVFVKQRGGGGLKMKMRMDDIRRDL